MRRDEGFTLIEILVVILIIGILAAIAIPSFLGQSAKARAADAKSGAAVALRAVESYGIDNNGNGYTGATTASLVAQEASLRDAQDDGRLLVSGTASSNPDKTTFVVGVQAQQERRVVRLLPRRDRRCAGSARRAAAPAAAAAIPGVTFPGYSSVGTW